jgi:hypothetical protein
LGGNWDNTSGWFNVANSTVTFSGVTETAYLLSGGTNTGKIFYGLVLNSNSNKLEVLNDLYISNNFRGLGGLFSTRVSSSNVTVMGDWNVNSGDVAWGTGTLTVDGSFYNNNGSNGYSTVVMTGVNKDFSAVAGYAIGFETVRFEGSSNVKNIFPDIDYLVVTGTMNHVTQVGVSVYNDMRVSSTGRVTGSVGGNSFYASAISQMEGIIDLDEIRVAGEFSTGTYNAGTFRILTGHNYVLNGGTYRFGGNVIFDAGSGSGNLSINNSVNNPDFEFLKDVSLVQSSGRNILWNKGSGNITFAGTTAQKASFIGRNVESIISENKSSGGLTFVSSFTTAGLSLNAAGLSSAATIYFAGKSTFTISTFTIQGTSAYPVTLKSTDSANGNHWYLNNTHQNNVSYAQVSYSSASAGVPIYAANSVNLGNNHNWVFMADTGYRYWVASGAGNWSNPANWSVASGGPAAPVSPAQPTP